MTISETIGGERERERERSVLPEEENLDCFVKNKEVNFKSDNFQVLFKSSSGNTGTGQTDDCE
jgi:hypothetical protein